jgi:hypothetical protein
MTVRELHNFFGIYTPSFWIMSLVFQVTFKLSNQINDIVVADITKGIKSSPL